jgi:hypothetical protein
MARATVGRNDVCPCGSGRKYKQCCARKQEEMSLFSKAAVIGVLVAMAVMIVYTFTSERGSGSRQVWDPNHGHYHTVP